MKIGQQVMDRYVLEDYVATGGMGTVFKARDGDQYVAVKVLRRDADSQTARFTREAHLLMDIDHPGIVRCLNSGVTEMGDHFLIMEWLDGLDLGRLLDSGPLPFGDTLTLMRRLSHALGHAHDRGIVHRDVKPSNIFLPAGHAGRCKLLDFGIAHWFSGSRLTGTGMQLGTPSYMSPEQIQGFRDIGPAADVFALGCVFFECLGGQQAYPGNDPVAVFYSILSRPPPDIASRVDGVPAPVRELLARMMQRDAFARPRDGNEVTDAIIQLQSQFADHELTPVRRGSRGRGGITTLEQQLVSVVAIEKPPVMDLRETLAPTHTIDAVSPEELSDLLNGSPDDSLDDSLDDSMDDSMVRRARSLWQRYESLGARFDYLHNGVMIVVLETGAVAADCAEIAARCALEMQLVIPEQPIAVATGRALLGDNRVLGEVVERSLAVLARSETAEILLDEVTAQLIQSRFDIELRESESVLVCERSDDRASMLLGQPTPFMGRMREMVALEASLLECFEERFARAVILSGESGMGKSRVKRELLRRIDHGAHDPIIWTATGRPVRSGSPLQLLAQAVRHVADIREDETLEVRRDKLQKRVSTTVDKAARARVTAFLGELIKTPFGADNDVQLRAARRDTRLMGAQIRQAFLDFLAADASRRPVIFVVESLQWADHASVTLLERALGKLANLPLFILAVGRPHVQRDYPRLFGKHDVMELRLRRLPQRIAVRMVRAALSLLGKRRGGVIDQAQDDALDDTLIGDLVQRADGNPRHLEELIRGLAAGRRELPETLLAMVHARLQALPFKARHVLRAASIFGDCCWLRGVRTVLGNEEDIALELHTLIDNELLAVAETSKFAGEVEYHFRHDLIREAAYGMLTADDRQLGHQLAGTWLELVGESDALILAEHFELGEDTAQAISRYLQAAQDARAADALDAAVEIARRGIELGASGTQLGRLLAVQTRGYQWQGQMTEAIECGERALQFLLPGDRAWYEVAEDLVAAHSKRNETSALESYIEFVVYGRPPGHDLMGWLILGARLSWMLFLSGNVDTACALLDRMTDEQDRFEHPEKFEAEPLVQSLAEAADRPRPQDTPVTKDLGPPGRKNADVDADENGSARGELELGVAARVHASRALRALIADGNPAGFLTALRTAVAFYERAGDRHNACDQQGNVGFAEIELGLYHDAEKTLRGALASADELGADELSDAVKQNLSIALLRQGQLDEAHQLASECALSYESRGHRRIAAACRVYLAEILRARNDLINAEREARAAIELGPDNSLIAALARAMLARVLLDQSGCESGALDAAQNAIGALRNLGGGDEGEALIRLTYAQALHASGKHAEAAVAIAAARDHVLERAAKIDHADWRQSFLHNVDEHVRILELHASWHGG